MSINKKFKPNDVVESSSDGEETMSTINTRPTERPSSPQSQCSICLDELTNPSHTNSCLHLFCFICIRRWAHNEYFCPLCKATFRYIYHSSDDLGHHKTYDVILTSDESKWSSDDDSDSSNGMPDTADVEDRIYVEPIIGQTRRYSWPL